MINHIFVQVWGGKWKEISVENQLPAFPPLACGHPAGCELFAAAHGNVSYPKACTYSSKACVPTPAHLCTHVQVCMLTASASFSPDTCARVAERAELGCVQLCTVGGRESRGRAERGGSA